MKAKIIEKKIKKWSEFLAEAAICKAKVYPVGTQFVYDEGSLPSGMTGISAGDILNLQRENGMSSYDVPGSAEDWVRIDGNPGDGSGLDLTVEQTLTAAQKQAVAQNINDRPAQVDSETVLSMGYKVLNPAMSFSSQVTAANTIYEIKDEFDLNGGSVTIPAGCTLKFNGGSLRNGTINFNYTLLDGNPLITTSIAGSIKNNQLNVLWLGARAEDKTFDNTPIFQKAIDWAENNKPSIVYVPIGTFYIKSTVNMKAGVKFTGEAKGNGKTVIRAASSMMDMFYSESSNGMRIMNIQIDGNRTGTYYSHATGFNSESTTLAENGINFYDLWYNEFNNVNVYNCSQWAIKIRHDSWVTDINNIGCYSCGNGILIGGLINGLKIRNSEFNTLGGFGIVAKQGHNFGIAQNTFEIMGKCAIALTNQSGCNITDNYTEYSSINGIDNFTYYNGSSTKDIDDTYHCTILLIGNAPQALDDNFERQGKIPINSAYPCTVNISNNYIGDIQTSWHHKFVLASGLNNSYITNNTLTTNVESVLGAFYYSEYTIFNNVHIEKNGSILPLQSVAEKLGGSPASAAYYDQGRLYSIWSDIIPNPIFKRNIFNYINIYATNGSGYIVEQNYKINGHRAYKASITTQSGYIEITFPTALKDKLEGTSKILLLEWYEKDETTEAITYKRQTINLNLTDTTWYFNRGVQTKAFTMPIVSLLGAKKPEDTSYNFYRSESYIASFLNKFKLLQGNYVSIDFDGVARYVVTKDIATPNSSTGYTECYSKNSNSLRYSSAVRPTPDSTAKGYMIYDETLKKPIWWNGIAWADANGETAGLQVSDKSILIGAATDSSVTVNIYHANALTVSALNPDNTPATWLTVPSNIAVGTNTLAISAAANTASNPRGAKVIISDGTDVVIVNVVQNYSTT